jgi:hypothetical protein
MRMSACVPVAGSGRRTSCHQGWLRRQAPYLNVHQFSLAPLATVARREVLYALAQREGHRQKIDPTVVRQAVARDVSYCCGGSNRVGDGRVLNLGCQFLEEFDRAC